MNQPPFEHEIDRIGRMWVTRYRSHQIIKNSTTVRLRYDHTLTLTAKKAIFMSGMGKLGSKGRLQIRQFSLADRECICAALNALGVVSDGALNEIRFRSTFAEKLSSLQFSLQTVNYHLSKLNMPMEPDQAAKIHSYINEIKNLTLGIRKE